MVLYAYMCCVCVFSLHRESLDMILGDKRELALKASQAVAGEWAEWQLPTFARASQNVAAVVVLLDALPAPFADRVGEVYRRLKSILGATAV
jgi:hypothetical protein